MAGPSYQPFGFLSTAKVNSLVLTTFLIPICILVGWLVLKVFMKQHAFYKK
jgi:hypothetical protein